METLQMKKAITTIIIILVFMTGTLLAQEPPVQNNEEESTIFTEHVKTPVNLYDTYTFGREKWPYIRTGMWVAGPVFISAWGVAEWGWFKDNTKFNYEPSDISGADAYDGMSDKFGHMYTAYVFKRLATFGFRATGSSPLRANIEGAIYSDLIMFIMEIGDGYSTAYGFDIYDFYFNNLGVLLGVILDASPTLDRIFAIQMEYIPTRRMREGIKEQTQLADPFTDYSGQKCILAVKLAGIPYVSETPLRYVNLDFGYYARGYYNDDFDYNTRNVYAGISLNFSIFAGDILPTGYISSTAQTFFNYYHVPYDIEVKDWELTRMRND